MVDGSRPGDHVEEEESAGMNCEGVDSWMGAADRDLGSRGDEVGDHHAQRALGAESASVIVVGQTHGVLVAVAVGAVWTWYVTARLCSRAT